MTHARENERQRIRGVARVEDQQIEPAPRRGGWMMRPGTARAAVEELDASYRAAAMINNAFQLVREVMNHTYELDCQVEYLRHQRELVGGAGDDMLYARLLDKQERFDRAVSRVLEGYAEHHYGVRRVTHYQYGYREEGGSPDSRESHG